MRILLTGGTGLVGVAFIASLDQHYHLTLLSRSPDKTKSILATVRCQVDVIQSLGELDDLSGFDAVINLAGEPIADKRWSYKQKYRICHSRWRLTQSLHRMIANTAFKPPEVFISGSAIGYYGRQGDTPVTENDNTPSDEFSHRLCNNWEKLALQSQSVTTRVCLLRTGIVLSSQGGALKKMLPAFKLGLGGRIGNGKQYMSWIHIADMVNAIHFLLNNEQCQGPYNLTAPNPVTNDEFSYYLAKQFNRPSWLPVPGFVLKLILGEMSDLLLYGQRVIPEQLLQQGFEFRYSTLQDALQHLFTNKK